MRLSPERSGYKSALAHKHSLVERAPRTEAQSKFLARSKCTTIIPLARRITSHGKGALEAVAFLKSCTHRAPSERAFGAEWRRNLRNSIKRAKERAESYRNTGASWAPCACVDLQQCFAPARWFFDKRTSTMERAVPRAAARPGPPTSCSRGGHTMSHCGARHRPLHTSSSNPQAGRRLFVASKLFRRRQAKLELSCLAPLLTGPPPPPLARSDCAFARALPFLVPGYGGFGCTT